MSFGKYSVEEYEQAYNDFSLKLIEVVKKIALL